MGYTEAPSGSGILRHMRTLHLFHLPSTDDSHNEERGRTQEKHTLNDLYNHRAGQRHCSGSQRVCEPEAGCYVAGHRRTHRVPNLQVPYTLSVFNVFPTLAGAKTLGLELALSTSLILKAHVSEAEVRF